MVRGTNLRTFTRPFTSLLIGKGPSCRVMGQDSTRNFSQFHYRFQFNWTNHRTTETYRSQPTTYGNCWPDAISLQPSPIGDGNSLRCFRRKRNWKLLSIMSAGGSERDRAPLLPRLHCLRNCFSFTQTLERAAHTRALTVVGRVKLTPSFLPPHFGSDIF